MAPVKIVGRFTKDSLSTLAWLIVSISCLLESAFAAHIRLIVDLLTVSPNFPSESMASTVVPRNNDE